MPGTYKLSDNFIKYVDITEITFVLKEGNYWVSWNVPRRFYIEHLKYYPEYDNYIKELLC